MWESIDSFYSSTTKKNCGVSQYRLHKRYKLSLCISCAKTRRIRITMSGKIYQCSECEYCCVQFSTLKTHMRCHTGERLYSCSYCTYAAMTSSNLQKHMLIHENCRPYECEDFDKPHRPLRCGCINVNILARSRTSVRFVIMRRQRKEISKNI